MDVAESMDVIETMVTTLSHGKTLEIHSHGRIILDIHVSANIPNPDVGIHTTSENLVLH